MKKDLRVIEIELLNSLVSQEVDYRAWEERFFTSCRDYLSLTDSDHWSGLLTASRSHPDDVQAKVEYLLHVFRHLTGVEKFDSSKLKFNKSIPLNTSFWDRDFRPEIDLSGDNLANRFGLQRGLLIDRLQQFLTVGVN